MSGKCCLNAVFHVTHRDLLHAVKVQHGTDVFTFFSEGRSAEDFFRSKNPTASAGREPANLGTKAQHATSRATDAVLQWDGNAKLRFDFNILNTELNPICHLLALLEAHRIVHVSRIGVNASQSISIYVNDETRLVSFETIF
jgi:hypothetical protein